VTGHVSAWRGKVSPNGERLVFGKMRGSAFAISSKAMANLAWLLKMWGFWYSLAIVKPVGVLATLVGLEIVWLWRNDWKTLAIMAKSRRA
jgi:hypothetical protein